MWSSNAAAVAAVAVIASLTAGCSVAPSTAPTPSPSATTAAPTQENVEIEPDSTSPPEETSSPTEGTFSDEAGWEDGLSYSVVSVKKFKADDMAIALGVFEKGQVAIEVKVKFTNTGNLLNSADFVNIRLLVGANENEAPAFYDPGGNGHGAGWSGKELTAGKSEIGSFAFRAEPSDAADGTVVVIFDRGFVGELRERGSIGYVAP